MDTNQKVRGDLMCTPAGGLSVDVFLSYGPVRSVVFEAEIHPNETLGKRDEERCGFRVEIVRKKSRADDYLRYYARFLAKREGADSVTTIG